MTKILMNSKTKQRKEVVFFSPNKTNLLDIWKASMWEFINVTEALQQVYGVNWFTPVYRVELKLGASDTPQAEEFPQTLPRSEPLVPQSLPRSEPLVPQSLPRSKAPVPQSLPRSEAPVPQSSAEGSHVCFVSVTGKNYFIKVKPDYTAAKLYSRLSNHLSASKYNCSNLKVFFKERLVPNSDEMLEKFFPNFASGVFHFSCESTKKPIPNDLMNGMQISTVPQSSARSEAPVPESSVETFYIYVSNVAGKKHYFRTSEDITAAGLYELINKAEPDCSNLKVTFEDRLVPNSTELLRNIVPNTATKVIHFSCKSIEKPIPDPARNGMQIPTVPRTFKIFVLNLAGRKQHEFQLEQDMTAAGLYKLMNAAVPDCSNLKLIFQGHNVPNSEEPLRKLFHGQVLEKFHYTCSGVKVPQSSAAKQEKVKINIRNIQGNLLAKGTVTVPQGYVPGSEIVRRFPIGEFPSKYSVFCIGFIPGGNDTKLHLITSNTTQEFPVGKSSQIWVILHDDTQPGNELE
jgi:hypothetical protein